MNIPEEILKSIIWNNRKDDEAIQRIRSFVPTGDCEDCGLQLCKTRILKISRNTSPFPHQRLHCNICLRYKHAQGEPVWYDNIPSINRAMYSLEYRLKYDPQMPDILQGDK